MTGALSRRAVFALAGLACLTWAGPVAAAPMSFTVPLSGAEEIPPLSIPAKGTASLTWDPGTRVVAWTITMGDLSSPVTMAHFHNGAQGKSGPVQIWLTENGNAVTNPIKGSATLTPEQAKAFEAGDWYINVHTKDHPAGEIRGQVTPPKG
ncbi:MAG TPA: CHRD domain-containing protein [Alphaproteobacteria bacterium]|nr:CHRD domain-containing protein [Alphaproteobacteria bacterium]